MQSLQQQLEQEFGLGSEKGMAIRAVTVEFQVTGKDPLTGAIAGVTGEATAQYLTEILYNKAPSELTASEKENISTLSQLAGGLAGALTANANGSSENQGGGFLTAVAGAETAKRAVENNYVALVARGCTAIPSCRNKVAKEIIEYGVKAGITGVVANEIVENISQEDVEHFITLSLMGNDEVTKKYLNYLTVKYSNSDIKFRSYKEVIN